MTAAKKTAAARRAADSDPTTEPKGARSTPPGEQTRVDEPDEQTRVDEPDVDEPDVDEPDELKARDDAPTLDGYDAELVENYRRLGSSRGWTVDQLVDHVATGGDARLANLIAAALQD